MKPKISKNQLVAILNLMSNLKELETKKIAFVDNIIAMVNHLSPNSIFIRYEKSYSNGGEPIYEYKIAEINRNGRITFIDDKFRNIFERYSFLGECKTFDIENKDEFEQID